MMSKLYEHNGTRETCTCEPCAQWRRGQALAAPPRAAVFSRPECPFQYCDQKAPGICEQRERCHYSTEASDAAMDRELRDALIPPKGRPS